MGDVEGGEQGFLDALATIVRQEVLPFAPFNPLPPSIPFPPPFSPSLHIYTYMYIYMGIHKKTFNEGASQINESILSLISSELRRRASIFLRILLSRGAR